MALELKWMVRNDLEQMLHVLNSSSIDLLLSMAWPGMWQ